MPATSLATVIAEVKKAEAEFTKLRDAAVAQLRDHLDKHVSEARAAQEAIASLIGRVEDKVESAAEFVLTSPSKTRASTVAALRWGMIGLAALVAIYGIAHAL